MGNIALSAEEIGRRGQELYDRAIREQVEENNRGRFLVLDIETGDYEIGSDYGELARGMQARKPGALLYAVRIGYPAVGRLGGGWKGNRR
jgi:hypothetical protein